MHNPLFDPDVNGNTMAWMADTARYRERHDEEYNFHECSYCEAIIDINKKICDECKAEFKK